MSIAAIFAQLLSGLESSIVGVVTAVISAFIPQLAQLPEEVLTQLADNFRAFLDAVAKGTPWGQALADMMTADWNDVEEDAKAVAVEFASTVATVLHAMGLIPQGK